MRLAGCLAAVVTRLDWTTEDKVEGKQNASFHLHPGWVERTLVAEGDRQGGGRGLSVVAMGLSRNSNNDGAMAPFCRALRRMWSQCSWCTQQQTP